MLVSGDSQLSDRTKRRLRLENAQKKPSPKISPVSLLEPGNLEEQEHNPVGLRTLDDLNSKSFCRILEKWILKYPKWKKDIPSTDEKQDIVRQYFIDLI